MIKSLIIENEIEAANALTSLLDTHCKNVSVIGVHSSISSALEAINTHIPDLIFLDVELEGESGFDLFKKTSEFNFEVIFTTAFSDYAVRAIKHACLEYLLKPVQKDELIIAVKKFSERQKLSGYREQVEILLQNLKKPFDTKLCIPVSGGFVYLNKSEIIMCQAEANYTLIHSLTSEKVLCSKNIGLLEEMIDDDNMFRCHKSYLVNINYIKRIQKKDDFRAYMQGGLYAEVSQRKKDELHEKLKKIS